jgi:serine/threonine protein kinase
MARPDADQPGTEPVPGYRLLNRVGAGGAGEVWCAEAPGGLRVALKIVRLSGGLGRREVANLRILRAIRHPNLLAYFGAWQLGGRLIIGMELADRSLWDRFAEARSEGQAGIPLGELLDVLGEVAKVIDFLNEPIHRLEGGPGVAIHHRDIKPQNIMLIGRGVKVADFGLSCLDDAALASRSLCGLTVAYAAPETFRHQVTAGSDQYSLAVTFCQLRGGRLPFVGPPASVMMGHLFGDPDFSTLPQPECAVVRRAMAKRPWERWPDCRSFVEALVDCARTASPDSLPGGGPERPDEDAAPSRSVVIPPVSGHSPGSLSVSSDDPTFVGLDDGASTYCLDLPSLDDPGLTVSAATTTSPTVVIADLAGHRARRRVPRLIVAVGLIAPTAMAAWWWSARPASRADAPSIPTTAILKSTSQPPPPPPPARRAVLGVGRPEPLAISLPTPATIRRPAVSVWNRLTHEAPATARSVSTRLSAIRRPSIAARTPAAFRSTASTPPARPDPPPELRVGMPEVLEVEAGRSVSIPIQLNRAGSTEPLAIHFDGLPAGVTMPDVTIPAGQDRAEIAVRARLDASEAARPIVMSLRAGSVGGSARFQLRVRANPAKFHRTLGHTLLACGRPAEAIPAFTRALQAGVSDAFVYNNRGLAYSALNQLDPAIADFTEAIRLRPADAGVRYNRGVAFARRGDDFRALLDFDTAIRLGPDHARSYEARAQIYLKQGDKARACADSTRAAELARAARPEGRPPAPVPPQSHATTGSGPAAPSDDPASRAR